MAEIDVNKDNFEQEVLKSDIPVLVDFWAAWCGPCKMLGPIVAQLAEEYDGKIKVAKVDCDENEELAMEYGVSSIPAVKIFKGGELVDESIGFVPKPKLEELIKKYVALVTPENFLEIEGKFNYIYDIIAETKKSSKIIDKKAYIIKAIDNLFKSIADITDVD